VEAARATPRKHVFGKHEGRQCILVDGNMVPLSASRSAKTKEGIKVSKAQTVRDVMDRTGKRVGYNLS